MTFRLKANLIFVPTALICLSLAAFGLARSLHGEQITAARKQAALLTASADVAARYTQDEVRPLVSADGHHDILFIPQATPFYAIQAQARLLSAKLPDYSLRQVVLDPVGATDRPTDWEHSEIMALRATPGTGPVTREIDGANGHQLVLITPLQMTDGACGTCYPSRAAAPVGVIDAFGGNPGFDRKLGEIVGATFASAPLPWPGLPTSIILWLSLLGLGLLLALNVILTLVILRPLERITAIADRVSLGERDVAEFDAAGSTEIASLKKSFNRLRRSAEVAVSLLES